MKPAKAMIVLALLTLLPIASFAATKKHLTITEPVAVGNTVLSLVITKWRGRAADRRCRWNSSPPAKRLPPCPQRSNR